MTTFTMLLKIRSLQKELREEDQRYRNYLHQEYLAEQQREAEIDAMINSEVERQWQKRLKEWARQRAARKKLMNDVLQTRRQQVQEKCKILQKHSKLLYVKLHYKN